LFDLQVIKKQVRFFATDWFLFKQMHLWVLGVSGCDKKDKLLQTLFCNSFILLFAAILETVY